MVRIFLAEGFEEVEALTIVDLLRRAGIGIHMVSVTGQTQVSGSHGITVTADELLQEVDFEQTKMIVLPGGMPGTSHLEACGALMEQVDAFYRQGKCISAICAAPSILGHRGYLQGRKACSYPAFEGHLEGAQVTRNPVEVSEHVTTSRGMGTAIALGLAIVERYQGKEAALKLADTIVYGL